MDPGVGTPGALDFGGGPEKILGCFAKLTLDRARVGLFLPAAIFGPVIFQDEFPGLQNQV
jgi:hypothetical protein